MTKEKIIWTKIGNLEWSNDLGEMTWYDAKKKCQKIGGRLPTRVELIDLYDNHPKECQKLVKYQLSSLFWSSTELSVNTSYAWNVALHNGNTYLNTKSTCYDVRCVRDVDK